MRVGLDDGRRRMRWMRRVAPPGRRAPRLGGLPPRSKRLGPGRVSRAGNEVGRGCVGAGAGAGAEFINVYWLVGLRLINKLKPVRKFNDFDERRQAKRHRWSDTMTRLSRSGPPE